MGNSPETIIRIRDIQNSGNGCIPGMCVKLQPVQYTLFSAEFLVSTEDQEEKQQQYQLHSPSHHRSLLVNFLSR